MNCSYDPGGNLVLRSMSALLAPQITVQPASQVVAPDDFATLSVVVADAAGVTFQWHVGRFAIPGASGDSLLLTPDVIAANERQASLHVGPVVPLYFVVVTNSAGTVTSSLVQVMLDSDGDGLPDKWEMARFGTTASQRGADDADGDHVSNLDEFLDGTDPKDKGSMRPRLIAYSSAGGSVTPAPMKRSYDLGDSVTLTPIAFPPSAFIGWAEDLDGTNNPAIVTMDRNKTVVAKFAYPVALAAGLIALWRGETDASDLVGGHHGTFFVVTAVNASSVTLSGKVGGAFDLDGTVYVRVPNTAPLMPTEMTLEGWIYPTVASTGFQMIVAYGSNKSQGNSYHLSLVNRQLHFFTKPHFDLSGLSLIPLNQWTHVAGTCDGTSKCLYVNGVQESLEGGPLAPIGYDETTVPVTIGADWEFGASANGFHGRIDELAVYNRALSADEIREIYNADVMGRNVTQPYFTSASPLPQAALGGPYAQQVKTVLGKAPVSLSLAAGALPPGMSLSPAGAISGVPGLKGTFDFTIRATDALGVYSERLFVLQVV